MEELSKSVIKNQQLPKSMDYQLLRKEAIADTQQVSGDNWTDYNIHDPGVTILEQFCYALTDVAYRTNLSIEALLFHEGDQNKVIRSNALYPPEEIFPTSPITIADYRILILDHFPEKISNCWVNTIDDHKEGIQGLYDITLLLKSDVNYSEHNRIKKHVRQLFLSNRNLCENLHEIKILKPERICLSCEVDIYQDEDAEEILSDILFAVEAYFNPPLRFSTIEELEKQGKSLDEIFNISSYKHGFITQDQFKPKSQEFYISRIADNILDIKGVRGLHNLTVTQDGIPVHGDTIEVADDKYLTLGFLKSDEDHDRFEGFNIVIYKGGVINKYLKSAVIYSLEIKDARYNRNYEIQTQLSNHYKSKIKTPELISYESIQKSFPEIYGVGDYTPAKEEESLRLAQSSQLKAYLMFFDQIMANHLAQLSQISELFSIENIDKQEVQTYFTQSLGERTTDASELLKHKLPPKSVLLKKKESLENALHLNDQEQTELKNLLLDIEEKEDLVKRIANQSFNSLIKLSSDSLSQNKKFKNRDVVLQLKELQKYIKDNDIKLTELDEEGDKMLREIKVMMREELEEQDQYIDLDKRHLDKIINQFDDYGERKNRILSHLLGRFGERFSTDFHIKFSNLMEGESQENINKKLISLKSTFLKEIVNINKFRSRGSNFLLENAALENVPLKRKISLLLDLPPLSKNGLASSELKKKLKVSKLTGADVLKKKDKANSYIEPKDRGDKVTFLINSSFYYTYLFKYGMKASNYSIEAEGDNSAVYFSPPTAEEPSLIFRAESKEEAHLKIKSLVSLFHDLNNKSEGFYLVEHILLRPPENNKSFFNIQAKDGSDIFKSIEAELEEVQNKRAIDSILLGCYTNNYKILRNPKDEFVAVIKNGVGLELAKSTTSFMTEQGAENFIQESVTYFNATKEEGQIENSFTLDNQKQYYFDLLDDKGKLLFHSIKALSIAQQENKIEDLSVFTINPSSYKIRENSDTTFSVSVRNDENEDLIRSVDKFQSSNAAENFIQDCLEYFEKIENVSAFKTIVRFRRVDGRNADDFNSQLSIVYSGWTSRFHNEEFLELFKQTVFNCAPAHIATNMVGLNFREMKKFEKLYHQYMEELAKASIENHDLLSGLSNKILSILIDQKSMA